MSVIDTVAAVSTPRGKGGIAVIRISGESTREILQRVFCPRGRDPVAHPRHAAFGEIRRPTGEVLDEGIALFFAAPHSFTGEDVAEISCHGGPLLTETVLCAVLEAGAVPASPGEFTARALMNGKMQLTEAEALGALLDADTEGRLALARAGMEGRLSHAVQALYERACHILADIFAKVDFPDEDLNSMGTEELSLALSALLHDVRTLAATWRTGYAVANGVDTVICGPVNAGKSTLYNALVGREAAIVTDVAGTTRDVLSETVSLGAVTLRLSDTAGLRETEDAVERIGVDRAEEAIGRAELVLAVFDASREADAGTLTLIERLKKVEGTVVAVLNKQDRTPRLDRTLLASISHVVEISAATGEIEPLKQLVERLYLQEGLDIRHDAIVANARQHAALVRAAEALDRALEALHEGISLDAVCVEAELAMSALGGVNGREVDEDIIAELFSHFCVGK
ncbi:MAG: tRNA uridine-5-carboxymethylaminomethyl(34) synthesis GTPase MnmE [Ruminococcaceae bacterium]|nr:tRNA uridine-5-carboxymethylaminomethyl(34) synthesis GTPase MnmE [Oscillospiraceae bacterium]